MIRKIIEGYEQYECSKCGTEVYEDDENCQVCGHYFNSVQNKTILENTVSEEETICVVIGCSQKNRLFTFAQLKVDTTPPFLRKLPDYRYRMMSENPNEFYVFKTEKYPNLYQGQQINLNLNHYDSYMTNGNTIRYDKRHFSVSDVIELKTYRFN